MSAPDIQVMRATDFANSIGVDTHIPYTDVGYGRAALVSSELAYLGTTEARDQLTNVRLDAAHADLAQAREDLAAAVRARDPIRHFTGMPESPEAIAAYDAVRAAKAAAARGEKEGRRA